MIMLIMWSISLNKTAEYCGVATIYCVRQLYILHHQLNNLLIWCELLQFFNGIITKIENFNLSFTLISAPSLKAGKYLAQYAFSQPWGSFQKGMVTTGIATNSNWEKTAFLCESTFNQHVCYSRIEIYINPYQLYK